MTPFKQLPKYISSILILSSRAYLFADGEVDSFKLIPVDQVANIILRTEFFKPNCALVIIDFLFRHGYSAAHLPLFADSISLRFLCRAHEFLSFLLMFDFFSSPMIISLTFPLFNYN